MLEKVPGHILITSAIFAFASSLVFLTYIWFPEYINLKWLEEVFVKSTITYFTIIISGSFYSKVLITLRKQQEKIDA
jgi:hypothetical protein